MQAAELLEPAGGCGELVRVDDDVGRQGLDRVVKRADFRQGERAVVAVHVHAARGIAGIGCCAVWVCARHDHDVEAGEQRPQFSLAERLGQGKHRFAAGRFVAVLLANQPHDRPTVGADRGRFGQALLREIEDRDIAALRGRRQDLQAQGRIGLGEAEQKRFHVGLRCEALMAGLQGRDREFQRQIGKLREYCW